MINCTFSITNFHCCDLQGASRAADYRYITGKLGLIAVGVMGIHYYFKYQGNVSYNINEILYKKS